MSGPKGACTWRYFDTGNTTVLTPWGYGVELHLHELLALFEQEFGIDMPLFLLTCRRAAYDQLFRLEHPEAEALVLPI